MKSVGNMVTCLEGLLGTDDLNDWEQGFVTGVVRDVKRANGSTTELSAPRVEKIEQIYSKHFIGAE